MPIVWNWTIISTNVGRLLNTVCLLACGSNVKCRFFLLLPFLASEYCFRHLSHTYSHKYLWTTSKYTYYTNKLKPPSPFWGYILFNQKSHIHTQPSRQNQNELFASVMINCLTFSTHIVYGRMEVVNMKLRIVNGKGTKNMMARINRFIHNIHSCFVMYWCNHRMQKKFI